jgi:hypothetical protein
MPSMMQDSGDLRQPVRPSFDPQSPDFAEITHNAYRSDSGKASRFPKNEPVVLKKLF